MVENGQERPFLRVQEARRRVKLVAVKVVAEVVRVIEIRLLDEQVCDPVK